MPAFTLTALRWVKYNVKKFPSREERAVLIRCIGKTTDEVIMMKKLLVLLLVLMRCMPAATAESSVYYITGGNADRVHLRAAPSTGADSLGLYFTGTDAILIDRVDGWAWVMIGAEEGWIMEEYLTGDDPAQLGPWYTVDNPQSTWVNLRMEPSMDGMVVMCPDNGTVVHILGETKDGWSYVECEGVKGYMVTDYLSPMAEMADQRTTILGETAEWDYIHQYIAPNGQSIYFTAMVEEPHITFRDVNFDGVTDIVVFVTIGASNFYTEFFVYDRGTGEYVRAAHRGIDYGLCNYQLYPEYGIVESQAVNGYAGALHEYCLFRWEGTDLKLIRRAVSEELTETSFDTDVYTNKTYKEILHMTVRDYQASEYGGTVIWEHTITVDESYARDIFAEEQEALWQGIK